MTTCPACGAQLAADAPAGLCPACLLAPTKEADGRAAAEAAIRAAFAAHVPGLALGECIGRGGSGLVFRATEPASELEFAVKVLDPALAREPAFAERFAREAEALARLAHPNVVAVHGHGCAGEHFYLVLEHVEGGNARELLARGPLAPKRAVALVTEVARALEFAHAQGIVHRDIKPENVLLDRQGHAKVADFGLARFADVSDARLALTSTGRALGTLRYMAPEQLEHPEAVDQRADLYALGVVFYEMLTGEVPMGRFEPPSKRAGVDPRLDEMVLHLLDRDLERRYGSARELLDDLENPQRVPAPQPDRGLARGRRFSWLAVSALMVSVLAILPGVFFVLFLTPAAVTSVVEADKSARQTVDLRGLSGLACSLLPWSVAYLLGRAGLDRIRARWPELYGVGAAVAGIWIVPLVLLNIVVGVLLATWLIDLESGERVSGWTGLAFMAIALSFDAWWIRRKQREVLNGLTRSAGVWR